VLSVKLLRAWNRLPSSKRHFGLENPEVSVNANASTSANAVEKKLVFLPQMEVWFLISCTFFFFFVVGK
jgi:hypothetical protein